MTLDREDIAAIAAELARLLGPMLGAVSQAAPVPSPAEVGESDQMTDGELVLLMAQPDPLAAIRAREKKLREGKPRGRKKLKAA